MSGLGGIPPRRPDQMTSPPPTSTWPDTSDIVRARQVIIFGTGGNTGLFVYNGTPANGNPPVLSIVPPGVTSDPYDNPVVSVLELAGSAGIFQITDPALIRFVSGSTTTGSIESNTAASVLQVNGPNGINLNTGSFNPVILSGGAYVANGAAGSTTPAPWVAFTGLNFANGWTGTFKSRLGAENEIKFQCSLTPGTDTDGTVVGSFIGGPTPAAAQMHPVWCNALRTGAVGTATESSALQLDTSGNVKCFGIAAAATSVVGNGYWSLDT